MDILITGGSGFIGSALSTRLLQQGHGVCVLSRQPARSRQRLAPAVRVVSSLDELERIDAVVNLQGQNLASGRWTAARKQSFVRSRVDFTHKLVQWMSTQAHRPGLLISGSAIGWYGHRGEDELDEAAAPGSDFASHLCQDWEQAALGAERLGLRVQRLRIGVVLDAEGGALAKMLPAFKLGLGGPLGSGQQWMSWITRQDLLRLIGWLLQREPASAVFNATAPGPLRQRDFAKALGAALHRPALVPTPAFALRALFGEMSELLLGSQRVIPQAALESGFRFEHADIRTALQAIL